MSDYRYQLVKHNGIDCLHVMLDGGDETHIPLDDILESAVTQGYMDIVKHSLEAAKHFLEGDERKGKE